MKYTVTAEEAAFTKAEQLSRGVIRFDIVPAPKSAKTLMTDWIDTGLGSGRHLVMTTVMDGVYLDEIPVGEERLFFGRSDYFKDAGDIPAVPEVKTSVVLSVETGKFRLALKIKPDSFEGSIRILWTAVKMAEAAVSGAGTAKQAEETMERTAFSEAEEAAEMTEKDQPEETGAVSFYIENPPKVLHPGWEHTFRVHEEGQTNAGTGAVLWSVASESGDGEDYTGSIDENGKLTAPLSPGVIEVTAIKEGTQQTASIFVVVT